MATFDDIAPSATPEPYSLRLRCTEGGSDKVYALSIDAVGPDLFRLDYANGRYGGTLTSGTKTQNPVSYEEAVKLCVKVAKEKLGKGYEVLDCSRLTPDNAVEAIAVVTNKRDTGYRPQLLNAIEATDLSYYLTDPDWFAQEKLDGERRMVRVDIDERLVIGINRKGQEVALPLATGDAIFQAVRDMGWRQAVLDGEQIGEVYHAFDVLEIFDDNGLTDLRKYEAILRYGRVHDLWTNGHFKVARTAGTLLAKRELLDAVTAEGGEGVVFKHVNAPYEPGRPSSGGNQMKYKLYNTLTAIVGAVNNQRSVALQLMSGVNLLDVGNVTVPANQPIPEINDIVEVRYLYAYEGGSLYQPTLLGIRGDMGPGDCLASQRKFKPSPALSAGCGM